MVFASIHRCSHARQVRFRLRGRVDDGVDGPRYLALTRPLMGSSTLWWISGYAFFLIGHAYRPLLKKSHDIRQLHLYGGFRTRRRSTFSTTGATHCPANFSVISNTPMPIRLRRCIIPHESNYHISTDMGLTINKCCPSLSFRARCKNPKARYLPIGYISSNCQRWLVSNASLLIDALIFRVVKSPALEPVVVPCSCCNGALQLVSNAAQSDGGLIF